MTSAVFDFEAIGRKLAQLEGRGRSGVLYAQHRDQTGHLTSTVVPPVHDFGWTDACNLCGFTRIEVEDGVAPVVCQQVKPKTPERFYVEVHRFTMNGLRVRREHWRHPNGSRFVIADDATPQEVHAFKEWKAYGAPGRPYEYSKERQERYLAAFSNNPTSATDLTEAAVEAALVKVLDLAENVPATTHGGPPVPLAGCTCFACRRVRQREAELAAERKAMLEPGYERECEADARHESLVRSARRRYAGIDFHRNKDLEPRLVEDAETAQASPFGIAEVRAMLQDAIENTRVPPRNSQSAETEKP